MNCSSAFLKKTNNSFYIIHYYVMNINSVGNADDNEYKIFIIHQSF